MNIQDAANLLDIKGEVNPETIKLAYRRARMKYHPDRNPAGLVMMQAINAAYQILKDFSGNVADEASGYDTALNDAINAIINLEGLTIEVCGNWIWVSGETLQHKDILKKAGYKWAPIKKNWFYRPEEYKSNNKTAGLEMDTIRMKHGSLTVKTKKYQSLERQNCH